MPRSRSGIRGHHHSAWASLFEDLAEGKGMSNAEIANRAGVHETTVHGWMTGKLLPPMDARLGKVMDALELPPTERREFEIEASLSHAPSDVGYAYRLNRRKVRELNGMVAALKAQLQAAGIQPVSEPEVIG